MSWIPFFKGMTDKKRTISLPAFLCAVEKQNSPADVTELFVFPIRSLGTRRRRQRTDQIERSERGLEE
jgi:hypothetical protein